MSDILLSEIWHNLTYIPEEPIVFTSGLFLWLFLFFSAIYGSLYRRTTLRLLFVTLFSYYFYYKSSGYYFAVLAMVTVTDFHLAKYIEQQPFRSKNARLGLAASIVIDLSLLAYFKYVNFFGGLLTTNWTDLDIFLPVGVSFFTFQSLSYTIDIYRGKLKSLDSLLDYAFYISFFPQLVAGPIVRATVFVPQIRQKMTVTPQMFGLGTFLILSGIFKKAVISDYISLNFVDRIFEEPLKYNGIENLLATYGYTLQLYCDFSGYSDIAIGMALWLGFHFPENFRSPYKAASITEFWRRWHITLSYWLRDYVYISLGGNRRGKLRQYVNLMITMLLGGLWHGANLTFVLWGGIHGVMLCIDKLWHRFMPWFSPVLSLKSVSGVTPWRPRLIRGLGVFLTFHIVAASWVLFRSSDFDIASQVFTQIFTRFDLSLLPSWIVGYKEVALLMVIGYAMHFCPSRYAEVVKNYVIGCSFHVKVALFVVMIWLVFQVKNAAVQPFIYFQF